MKKLAFVIATFVFALPLAGCEMEEASPTTSESAAVSSGQPQICPQIAILCIEGYHAKDVGNCRQICVPDHGAECTVDADCAIYCVTTPCPQGRCVGGNCRVFESRPTPTDPTSSCSPACGAGEWCQPCRTLDGVENVCLPEGAVC